MDHQEQLNQVIAALEKEIASQESKATDLSFDIKVKKAKLKQLKKINDNGLIRASEIIDLIEPKIK